MQTYSHYILTKAYERYAKKNGSPSIFPPLAKKALLWGSLAPDIPLILISIGFILYDLSQGNLAPPTPDGSGPQSATGYLFEYMFFNTWWVKAAHNLFHAPLMVVGYIALGYFGWKKNRVWGTPLFWLGIACLFHTLIDIPLHYDDGPLLLFPFDWNIRFYSPVSYWDPNRYGTEFAIFEHTFIAGMLIWLIWDWWRGIRQAN